MAANPKPRKPPTTEKDVGHPKLQAAVELGHRGGLKGGPTRARKLGATERSHIATEAALARWRSRRRLS